MPTEGTIRAKIRLRGDTAERLADLNPVLKSTEPAFETDTGKMKIGDGVNAWNDLDYAFDNADWDSITNKPSTFPPSAHTHAISGVTGLQAALDAKQAFVSSPTNNNIVTTDALGQTKDSGKKFNDAGTSTSDIWTADKTKTYADGLVVGLLDDRGSYNASGNTFPASGGSGTAGAILKGDLWYISVSGTLGGVAVTAGYSIRALVDTPGQTAGNWDILNVGLGYVPENIANKDTDTSLAANSDTKYASQKAVKTYVDAESAARTLADDDIQSQLDALAPTFKSYCANLTQDTGGLPPVASAERNQFGTAVTFDWESSGLYRVRLDGDDFDIAKTRVIIGMPQKLDGSNVAIATAYVDQGTGRMYISTRMLRGASYSQEDLLLEATYFYFEVDN